MLISPYIITGVTNHYFWSLDILIIYSYSYLMLSWYPARQTHCILSVKVKEKWKQKIVTKLMQLYWWAKYYDNTWCNTYLIIQVGQPVHALQLVALQCPLEDGWLWPLFLHYHRLIQTRSKLSRSLLLCLKSTLHIQLNLFLQRLTVEMAIRVTVVFDNTYTT